MSTRLALIGCGKMGSALLNGWLNIDTDRSYIIVDPADTLPEITNNTAIDHIQSIQEIDNKDLDIIVLAIKPQIIDKVLKELKPIVSKKTLIISIIAGTTINTFEKYFGSDQPIIRTMPNTPAAIGKGMIAAIGNQNTNKTQIKTAHNLLSVAGKVEWITDEALMDAVTAVSGSGPAYLFLLIEAMSKAGENAGLTKELSAMLARQTIIGAAALAEQDPQEAKILRQNVTSTGGTTEAALNILMDNNEFQTIINNAINAAMKRSQELSET